MSLTDHHSSLFASDVAFQAKNHEVKIKLKIKRWFCEP